MTMQPDEHDFIFQVNDLLARVYSHAYLCLKSTSIHLHSNFIHSIFIYVQNPCKRHVSLCSSVSIPYIQSNSMLLRWHWCRICHHHFQWVLVKIVNTDNLLDNAWKNRFPWTWKIHESRLSGIGSCSLVVCRTTF